MVVVGRGTVWYKKLLGRLRGSSRDAGSNHAAEPPHQRRPLHGPALPRRPPLTAQWTGCPSSTPTSRFPFRESCTGSAAPATGQVQRLKRWSQCCSARGSAQLRTMFSTLHPGKPCIPHPPASPSPRACDTTASERIVSDPQAPCTRSDAHANPRVPVASSTLSRTPRHYKTGLGARYQQGSGTFSRRSRRSEIVAPPWRPGSCWPCTASSSPSITSGPRQRAHDTLHTAQARAFGLARPC